ncbi:tetratricopeptide repeat protein [Deinococcus sp.]|uniref:tetratricopeptide repeat protein n=1 Tax=Deinococcus sp. TaxID=47478 RepID=UPI0025BB659A|nr:tetratricopeptide repeat protein [Deinococcus sp.]
MNRILPLLTVALLASTAAAQTNPSQPAPPTQTAAQWAATSTALAAKARATYQAGHYAIDQTLWRQAADAAEAAVAADPGNPDYLKLRAQLYTEIGFWKKAEAAWSAYYRAVPRAGTAADHTAAIAQYNLGYAAYTRQSPSQAAAYFDRCLKLDPQNVLCSSWAARTALEAGEYTRAQNYYAQALQLSPNDKTLAYFSGLAKSAGTYGPAATQAFSQAYIELDAGRKEQALAKFQEAARAAPNFAEAWREAGRLALELGNAQAAVDAYRGVSALPSTDKSDAYNLGLAREGLQYGLGAVQTFRAAYNQYVAGDRAAALSGFTQAATQNPTYAKAWAWVGRVQYEAKNFPAAAEAYSKAVALDPTDKSSAYYLQLAQQGK